MESLRVRVRIGAHLRPHVAKIYAVWVGTGWYIVR